MESKEDFFFIYFIVIVKVGLRDDENKFFILKKNSVGLEFDDFYSSCQDILLEIEDVFFNMSDSYLSYQLGVEVMNGVINLVEFKILGKYLEYLVFFFGQLEEDDFVVNGIYFELLTGKLKKRLSWFGKR